MKQIETLDHWFKTEIETFEPAVSIVDNGAIVPDEDFKNYFKSLKSEMESDPKGFKESLSRRPYDKHYYETHKERYQESQRKYHQRKRERKQDEKLMNAIVNLFGDLQ